MIVKIDLPLLKLNNIEFSDEHLRYNGYRLSTYNSELSKITDQFGIAEELFFQTETLINKGLLEQLNLDMENTTYELSNLLFGNLEFAVAVQKATDVRFDQIEVTYDGNGSNIFEIDGQEWVAMYEHQLMVEARDFYNEYTRDMSFEEIIGDIKYINDYFDVIDTENLAIFIKEEIIELDLDDYFSEETLDDDEKLIKAFIETGHGEEFILDTIEKKYLFDYEKYSETNIIDVEDALNYIAPYMGDLKYRGQTTLDGWKPSEVFVFERF